MKFERHIGCAFLLIVVLASCSKSDSTVNISETKSQIIEEEHIAVQKWKNVDKVARKFSAQLVKDLMPFIVQASQEMNLTSKCTGSLMRFLTGVKQTKLWAFKMLDASGKLPNGIYSGSINSLGDYDGCLETEVPGQFQGQYCLVEILPPLPPRRPFVSSDANIQEFINITDTKTAIGKLLSLANYFYHLNIRTSVCVPSTCTVEDVQMIGKKVMQHIGLEFDLNVPNCEIAQKEVVFSTSEIVIIIVLSILVLLGIIATISDVSLKMMSGTESYQDNLGFSLKCLLCFSFYTNTLRLLKKDNSKDSIKIFHGMKVITILWVILNHTYFYLNYQAGATLLEAREFGRDQAFQFVCNGFLNVETFFFISAVLVAYGVMKAKESRINVGLFIFRRFWRLTPPFMFVIACVFLLPHMGSGPVWKETVEDGLTEKCRKYWWSNLVYINNFVPSAEMCLQWTWYVPVDTHLYFLSLLVLLPLKRNPKLAFLINGTIFILGVMVSAALNVFYGLHPTAIYVYNHPDDINYYVDRGYFRTYLHCSTYCVGLTVGYILATRKNIRIPLITNIFGWLVSIVLALAVLYGVYDWNQGNVPGLAMSTLYTCTNKFVWSLALAWVTIACVTGNGGVITSFLSWEAFVPLGRLTYMAYLVHPIVQFVYFGSTRTLIRTAHRTLVFMYFGNVVLGFILAYILSLLFESPFMALERVVFSSSRPRSDKPEEPKHELEKEPIDEIDYIKNSNLVDDNQIYAIKIKKIEASYY